MVTATTAPAPMPLPEAVRRLTLIATRRLNTGQGPRTVRAWLGEQGTARIYGNEAVTVVAALFGGAR